MGQQVANCKSFTLTHYLAVLFAMHCGPRGSPLCVQHCIQPISFIQSQSTIPFLKYGYEKIDLENPRSRSWVRLTFKVKTLVQHPIDSHTFGPMLIDPLIPMIELFKIFTFKIQGQSHSSRSHRRYNILSIHISFIPCWPSCSWDTAISKLTLKIQVQGSKSQCESNILSTHIPLVPCQSALPFLRYSISKISP